MSNSMTPAEAMQAIQVLMNERDNVRAESEQVSDKYDALYKKFMSEVNLISLQHRQLIAKEKALDDNLLKLLRIAKFVDAYA